MARKLTTQDPTAQGPMTRKLMAREPMARLMTRELVAGALTELTATVRGVTKACRRRG